MTQQWTSEMADCCLPGGASCVLAILRKTHFGRQRSVQTHMLKVPLGSRSGGQR